MNQVDKKLLEIFCEEAKSKKFSSYPDEQEALTMYQRAVNVLMGTPDKNYMSLLARIRSYRTQHGREIWVKAV